MGLMLLLKNCVRYTWTHLFGALFFKWTCAQVFLSLRLPDTFTPSSLGEGHSTKLFELAKSVQWEGGGKRRGRREDSEDEGGEAPSNDIYRKRMHKKIK